MLDGLATGHTRRRWGTGLFCAAPSPKIAASATVPDTSFRLQHFKGLFTSRWLPEVCMALQIVNRRVDGMRHKSSPFMELDPAPASPKSAFLERPLASA
jgi:hypothetical protein